MGKWAGFARILTTVTGLLAALVAGASVAATITVTSAADVVNGSDGACTLREALIAASANAASGGVAGECAAGQPAPTVDVIAFAIPGAGVHTIAPTGAFAAIAEPVAIDGYTQAGASANTLATGSNAVLLIEIDASNAGAAAPLFRFVAGSGGAQVRGLVVNHLEAPAFDIRLVADVRIAGNFLGTNTAGTALAGAGPQYVIQTQSANGTTIGGTALADRNVIAGGHAAQLYLNGSANVVVQGNLIGTNALGTAALRPASAGVGVWLDFTQFAQVGGAQPNAGNVISGNAKGVVLQRGESGLVQGNRIGTDVTGSKPIPNDFHGIEIATQGPGLIGGTAAGEGNVIAFNGGAGIHVNASASGWRIVRNAVFENGGKGIALVGGPYPLANDILDADTGANERQNFPLIDDVTLTATTVRVQGRIQSRPARTLALDVYGSRPPVRPTDFLQGEVYLGPAPATITTDAQGRASFDVTLPLQTSANLWVTATVTDVTGCAAAACGDTSEFAQRGVFAVTPRWGSPTGQMPVTVTGQLFGAGARFAFGATDASAVAFVDAQTLTGQLPLLNPGTLYDVKVTNPDTSTATMPKAFVTDFLDVAPTSAWYGPVMNIAASGITLGCTPGYYCGDNNVSRAQMAVFLLRGLQGPFYVPPAATGIFADVPVGTFPADWIEQFYREGITTGCAANPLRYCPNDAVTRAQMAVFLLRTKHGSDYVPPPCTGLFADVSCVAPRHPFVDWIEQLAREGVTLGCAANPLRYCPDSAVLRLQMAAFLARTFGLDEATNTAPVVSAGGNQTITLPSGVTLTGFVGDDGLPLPPGVTTASWSQQSGPGTVTFTDATAPATTALFAIAGTYVLRLTASDGALSAFAETTITVKPAPGANTAPLVNAGVSQRITLPGAAVLSGTVTDDGQPNPPGVVAISWSKDSGPGTVTFAPPNAAATTASFSAAGAYVLRLTASDGVLSSSASVTITVDAVPAGGTLPPDPATAAPPIDPTLATDFGSATSFLYTGANPIQTGVAPGTIDPRRAAVIRGRLLDKSNNALPGVTVTIRNHPEYGQTLSRADGRFDLAVNGGGMLTLHYAKASLLPAQRQVNVPWLDYAYAGDTILIGQDARVTSVDLTNTAPAFHVAQGSVVTDQDGTRQTTLLIPQGTQARVYNPDGSTRPVTSLTLRFTEYTVGANGPTTMPAQLPPTSAYTYAFEARAAEGDVKIAGKDVLFDRPVPFYVDNFLDFPVGVVVPVGYYDQDRTEWIPSDNGKVIRILAITGGFADIDSNGDGTADDAPTLAALGITTAERQQLAGLYPAGKTLWRVPVTHLSLWDFNWPFVPPPDATSPSNPTPTVVAPDDAPANVCGSIIECENQVLRERLPVVGTRLGIGYASDWAAGNQTGRIVRIPLSGAQVPAPLDRIELIVDIAGRRFTQSFPALPNQQQVFAWDGTDAYGRTVVGTLPARVRIAYVYRTVFYSAQETFYAAFGRFSGVPLSGNETRTEAYFWQEHHLRLTGRSPKSVGLGGWSIDAHHTFDPVAGMLLLGSGERRHVDYLVKFGVITKAAGGAPAVGPGIGDGGPATSAVLASPNGVGFAPDGTFYIAESSGARIRRVLPTGIISTIAGSATPLYPCGADGVPALQVALCGPSDVALAPDGALYVAEPLAQRIRRIGIDGTITTVAGNGTQGFGGDGGPATAASLNRPNAIALGPDGSLYIAEPNHRIRRVGTDGVITTVAGNGTQGSSGDGGPSMQARLFLPQDVAVATDGSIYIADTYNHLIRRIGPDGIITTVAGRRNPGGPDGDGGFATDAGLWYPAGVEVGLDGSLFISEGGGQYPRVRHVGLDGIITTVAGNGATGLDVGSAGWAATTPVLRNPGRLGIGPDNSLLIPDSSYQRVFLTKPVRPSFLFVNGNFVFPSADGSELYEFDSRNRRHARTLDALTGAALLQFGYDAANRLVTVTDADGNVTTVERNAGGQPTAIVSPFGQRTTLTVDANGYLATVTNPAGEAHRMTYTAGGLLTAFQTPRGNVSTMSYDAVGRLTAAADAGGGSKALVRTDADRTYEVALASALGRTSRHRVESLATGDRVRVQTATDGTRTETLLGTDGGQLTNAPDGTVVDVDKGPDPRFSMLAPLDRRQVVTTGGLSSTTTASRTVVLSNPSDLLSLTSQSDTTTLNGRNYLSNYVAATRTFTDTTPANRESTTTLDAQGRPIAAQLAGLEPAAVTYDSRGRIATIVAGTGGGARTYTYAYNTEGFLASVTDPLGRVESYTYDAAGRVTTQTLPGGRVVQYAYDANGNLISLTPPGRPAHAFTHTPVDLMASYVPPNVGAGTNQTLYAYNVDRQLTQVNRPDGQSVAFGYDTAGRVNSTAIARGTFSYGYNPTTGQMTSIAAPDGLGLAYTYSGALLNTVAWSGPVAGTVARTYDNDFRVTGLAVNGASVPFAYDADSLLTGAGAMTLSRHPQNGLLTGTTLGNVTDAWSYNGFGEPVQYTASYGGSPIFQQQFTRDALGRIVQKVETIGGVTDTFVYGYDAAGRLAQVTKNGAVTATYTYDANGNRLAGTVAGVTSNGSYDAQDRMTAYGTATYAYTANGELASKTDVAQLTTYAYDPLGNLTAVALPGGTAIGYLVDGRNRRVGKKVNSTATQGFLYQSDLRPVAELDGSNNVVSRFVYGTKVNVPEYLVRGGVTYRIVTDHLGSPRLVVDTATGAVAQRLDYDEFGRVHGDTNPGFQPFGFGGGLYDKDTKLLRFGSRDYDAATGRWTSKDATGFADQGGNLFEYSQGDPINGADPTGTVTVLRVLPNGVRMVRFNPLQPTMTTLGAAAEPFALSVGSAAALAGAFAAGYAVGSLIDCGATAALGQSLGVWLYNRLHPEENTPAQWPPQASYPAQPGSKPYVRPSW